MELLFPKEELEIKSITHRKTIMADTKRVYHYRDDFSAKLP